MSGRVELVMGVLKTKMLQKIARRSIRWVMTSKNRLKSTHAEAVTYGRGRSFAPETLRPERAPQVASQLPDTVRLVTGMEPAATNMLACSRKEQRPILHSAFLVGLDLERQSLLDLLKRPSAPMKTSH